MCDVGATCVASACTCPAGLDCATTVDGGGACGDGHCGTGFACTDVVSDANNCNGCGNLCQNGTCDNGACACTGATPNYCPTAAASDNGVCANTETDPKHCGSSCEACPGVTPACCTGGCFDLNDDPNNCGACGTVCPAGCANGLCACPANNACQSAADAVNTCNPGSPGFYCQCDATKGWLASNSCSDCFQAWTTLGTGIDCDNSAQPFVSQGGVVSLMACYQLCATTAGCNFFDYYGNVQYCNLNTDCAAPYATAADSVGSLNEIHPAPTLYDSIGQNLTCDNTQAPLQSVGGVGSTGACYQLCLSTSGCKFFTYYSDVQYCNLNSACSAPYAPSQDQTGQLFQMEGPPSAVGSGGVCPTP